MSLRHPVSRAWTSHVTYLNEQCHIYKWVLSHIWRSHVTHNSKRSKRCDEKCKRYHSLIPQLMSVLLCQKLNPFITGSFVPKAPFINGFIFVGPQTEEIGLKIITTAKISNEFSRESPYISNTFSRQSPNLQTNFHVSKRSPRHSKDLTGNPYDLEIQIF